MGDYDRAMKLVVDANPEAIVQFIMQQWRLMANDAMQDAFHIIGQLNPEFQGTEAEADGLILIETESGKQFYVHIEFQSRADKTMPDRLIDYCLRIRRKHKRIPIISCVIHLRDEGHVEEPPGHWDWPDGSPNLLFKYVCIKLYELPREAITNLHQPALLPLSLLTEGQIDRIIIKDMFEALQENKLLDLLPVGQTIAGMVLSKPDLEWLKKEYHKMFDLFKDSPAYAWMTEDAREEGREEMRQQIHQALEDARQIVITLVSRRFPQLELLAKKQVFATNDLKRLQQLILNCSLAQDATEVEILLLHLDVKGND
jgi:hypothetical protein